MATSKAVNDFEFFSREESALWRLFVATTDLLSKCGGGVQSGCGELCVSDNVAKVLICDIMSLSKLTESGISSICIEFSASCDVDFVRLHINTKRAHSNRLITISSSRITHYLQQKLLT